MAANPPQVLYSGAHRVQLRVAQVGIAAGWLDVRLAFGNGWEMLNGPTEADLYCVTATVYQGKCS